MSKSLNDEDYNLNFESFQQKIGNLEPLQRSEYTTEYYRRSLVKKDKLITQQEAQIVVLTQRVNVMTSFHSLASGAPSTVFQYVSQLRPIPESSKTCPSEKIMECWKKCKASNLMQDLADGESVDEKAVQTAFVAGVRLILKTLGYCHSLVETSNVIGSAFKPDLILASQGVTKPGFQDVLAVVELKAPSIPLQDAVAQAGKYLNEISGRGNSDFSHLAHSSLVAIGSNYKEICIFGLSKLDPVPILGLYTTAQSELFPKEWKSIQNHTTGFSDLCHAIHQTGNSTSKYITINDCDVMITGTINEQEGVGVYFCTYLKQELVVKQGYGAPGNLYDCRIFPVSFALET